MFINYAKQYTDMPFLIMLDTNGDRYKAGRFLRASDLAFDEANAAWKPVIYDQNAGEVIVPNGTMGQRWEEDVTWNLILEREDGTPINPALTVLTDDSEWVEIDFPYFNNAGNGTFTRSIPTKTMTLKDGTEVCVATVYDLMLSQYGIQREGATYTATDYFDESSIYTPKWQEKVTGVK